MLLFIVIVVCVIKIIIIVIFYGAGMLWVVYRRPCACTAPRPVQRRRPQS